MPGRSRVLLAAALIGAALAGCGGDEPAEEDASAQPPVAAADPARGDFPASAGRTLEDLASLAKPGPQFAPATATYEAGRNRIGFGLIDGDGKFIYAPTAVYVGRSPASPARGPYPAPASSLVTEPAFRSRTAALESDAIASIYAAQVDLPRPGAYRVLVLSDLDGRLYGATASVEVPERDRVPGPGERAPSVQTETVEDVGGRISRIETRDPPDTMHGTDFADVVGERPVALLFATPQLCESRVCGPVTDIAEQLKTEYGEQIEFIHQEVYVDNRPDKGLRAPLRAFDLETEPWLFTIDAEGRVAARLEGSFGLEEFERAVRAAL